MLSDAELRRLGVPADRTDRFHSLLNSAVKNWRRPKKNTPPPRQGNITPHLDRLIKALEPLRNEGGGGEAAGALWQASMIDQCKVSIDDMIDAANNAKTFVVAEFRSRGAPQGTRTAAPGFDEFLLKLFIAAGICGFEWTAYKNRETGNVEGTLPKLLDILEPHLPQHYLPVSPKTRLNAIDRMRGSLHSK